MVLDWLGQGLVALTLLGCASLVVISLALLYLLGLHLRLRRAGLAREARLLAQRLPPDAALPDVVVQVPVFNESAVVERAIASLAQLDWPGDKLHIQLCDDSTDETTALARAAAERVSASGINVDVVHRDDREGFKAGALQAAMLRTSHEFFAIFDADFVLQPQFLRRCMAVLLADPRLGFVQARIDFLNVNQNVLTRAQTLMLDYHYGFEQATRCWADHLVPFNGTCGIWRRAAIEAAGGWSGETLLEDWDLSYRAWVKGWRGMFLTSVTAAGELPVELSVWMSQQRRWATGGGQVARKMLLASYGNGDRSLRERWNALVPLGTWLAYLMFSATIVLAIVAILLRPSDAVMLGLALYVVLVIACMVFFSIMLVIHRALRGRVSITRFVRDFAVVIMLSLYVSWANLRSLPGTLLGRSRVFVRTPKHGSVPNEL